MSGPYAVSDGQSEFNEWTCHNCGHICQKFRWEYETDTPEELLPTLARPWWKDPVRWAEMMERVRGSK
jgi:hypothetical protein